jgi:hypothetical protein
MTPQEAQRVTELFERLASLEDRPRDAAAEALIARGLQQAPNAVYALVQTVLVQDEALHKADARIRELEAGGGTQGSFLDSMREALFGGDRPRGSVPQVRAQSPGGPLGVPPAFGSGSARSDAAAQPQAAQAGGSFLGTAAAAAAGVIGGSLLLDSIRSLTGSSAYGLADSSGKASPWAGDQASSGGDLATEAGVNDIGQTRDHADDHEQHAYDTAEVEFDEESDMDFDFGDSDFG